MIETNASEVSLAGMHRHELAGKQKQACLTMVFNCCRVTKSKANAFPGSNPVSIERCMIAQLSTEPYWAGAKTDGQRLLLLAVTLEGVQLCVLIDRALRMFVVGGELPTVGFEGSLLDGELVECSDGKWRFYVFDAVHLSGVPMGGLPFSVRMSFVRSWLRDMGRGLDGIELVPKHFVRYGLDKLACATDIPADGLIFVPENDEYKTFRNDKLLKWKDEQQHTVDFKVDGVKLTVLNRGKLVEKGKLPAESAAAFNGKIVECKMKGGVWKVVKVRTDKTAPNDSYVYGKTVLNIEENISRSEFAV